MEFEHVCLFCDWRRPAHTLTMLRPHCERCGCVLEPRSAAVAPDRPERRGLVLPPRAGTTLAVLGALAVAAFAAKAGYDYEGAAAGTIALLVTLLALFGFLAPAAARR